MDKLTINGVALYLDMLDADVVERNEAAYKALTAEITDIETAGDTNAEGMKKQCRAVEHFIDAVFGPGTAETIFQGKKNHLGEHIDVLGQVTTYMSENSKDQTNDILARYAKQPGDNPTAAYFHAANKPVVKLAPAPAQAEPVVAPPESKEEKAAKIAALLAEML